MTDYWNSRFKAGKVWESEPSGTALIASEYFTKFEKKDVLVIGSGYGRNTNYFYENGYVVEGVEYAIDGIEIARRDNPNITYYNGSAFDMPLSDKKYSAVFCYNVIHLFIKSQRDELLGMTFREVKDKLGDDFSECYTGFNYDNKGIYYNKLGISLTNIDGIDDNLIIKEIWFDEEVEFDNIGMETFLSDIQEDMDNGNVVYVNSNPPPNMYVVKREGYIIRIVLGSINGNLSRMSLFMKDDDSVIW